MTTGFSASVILLLVTLVIASVGLILFILGLILKKPGQWIPGIILTAVSLIMGIFSLGLFFSSLDHSSYRSNDYSNYNYNYSDSDSNSSSNQNHLSPDIAKPETNTDESGSRISGFIQDADKSLIYIRIRPAADLYDMGIKVTKIDTYNGTAKGKKIIPLEIFFENKFKGNLQLILFSSSDEELGNSSVQINQSGNTTFTVKFAFDKSANFMQTDHAQLKTSD